MREEKMPLCAAMVSRRNGARAGGAYAPQTEKGVNRTIFVAGCSLAHKVVFLVGYCNGREGML